MINHRQLVAVTTAAPRRFPVLQTRVVVRNVTYTFIAIYVNECIITLDKEVERVILRAGGMRTSVEMPFGAIACVGVLCGAVRCGSRNYWTIHSSWQELSLSFMPAWEIEIESKRVSPSFMRLCKRRSKNSFAFPLVTRLLLLDWLVAGKISKTINSLCGW